MSSCGCVFAAFVAGGVDIACLRAQKKSAAELKNTHAFSFGCWGLELKDLSYKAALVLDTVVFVVVPCFACHLMDGDTVHKVIGQVLEKISHDQTPRYSYRCL